MKNKISRNLQNYDVLWSPRGNDVYLIEGRHIKEPTEVPKIYNARYDEVELNLNMMYLVLHDTDGTTTGLMSGKSGNCWVNKKNLNYYEVQGIVVDATNSNDGTIKVMYSRCGNTYVRDIYEFLNNFMPKFEVIKTIEPEEIIPTYVKARIETKEVK